MESSITQWTLTIIGLVADIMAILGIGGLVSWSVFKRERGQFDETVLSIFAYSVKTALCLAVLGVFGVVASGVDNIILSMSLGYFGPDTPRFWDPQNPLPYVFAHMATGLLFVPLSLLTCASLYASSLGPFRRFFRVFMRRNDGADPS